MYKLAKELKIQKLRIIVDATLNEALDDLTNDYIVQVIFSNGLK